MQRFNLNQTVFYLCLIAAILLLAFPFKGSGEYYRYLVMIIAVWVAISGVWNLLIATNIIIANKQMQRKIVNSGQRAVRMLGALVWIAIAVYIFYCAYMRLPLLPFKF